MNDWYATHPTADEMTAVFGRNWAVCRKTPRNLARYTRCLSRSEYERGRAEAMRRRVAQ